MYSVLAGDADVQYRDTEPYPDIDEWIEVGSFLVRKGRHEPKSQIPVHRK
eukprot:SAG11_NODE_18048_length_501_cov_1.179104_1_plen_49_part_10